MTTTENPQNGRSFLFVLGSSRADGNTETLARIAAQSLPADVTQRWIDLNELELPDFQDGRHDTDGEPASEAEEILRAATVEATDIVIVSPLYWYSVSAQIKRYLDYWSGWLAVSDLDLETRMKGGTLWGVTVMADREEIRADALRTTLNHTAAYLHMKFGGVLLGNGSRPGQVRKDERALRRAETFFLRDAPLARFPQQEQGQEPQQELATASV
ncbi:NAD(P)H-dependent oxidoreductase [Streptomyces sp. NPDC000594]|uniref:flavodoxin family protein n=1 Tax=Streptomyces sp. NPDC000594 TaxID=3154261 RepID=UPI003331C1BF